MKLLVDMNLSPRWVKLLADADIEAVHWSSIGAANARDVDIMGFARVEGYVVLTHDLDFGAILAATHGNKPSVVQIRSEEVSPDIIGKQVVAVLQQTAVDLEQGALVTVNPKRTRVRILPLRGSAE
jgi:predicted nuclease of predicted toxin-antitoxin system